MGPYIRTLLPITYHNVSNKAQKIITRTTLLLVLAILTSTTLVLCTINLFMLFSVGPQSPSIQINLNSLSVSNFTVSKTKLEAKWVADFTFYDPNFALEFSLDHIEGHIFDKGDMPLSIASLEGFKLGLHEQKSAIMEFATTGLEGDQPIVEYPVLRQIMKDYKEKGVVKFGIKMSVLGRYTTRLLGWTRHVVVNAYCFDLDVKLSPKSEVSTSNFMDKDCSVLMTFAT